MTRDEHLAQIRVGITRVYPTVNPDDVAFLLAELDAAHKAHGESLVESAANTEALHHEVSAIRARVQRLTDALRRLTEPMCSIQRDNGIIRERLLAIAGDDAMDRYKDALAAIAEGEDARE